MSDGQRPDFGRLVVPPIAAIGGLAAILLWEIEHAGSLWLALIILAVGLVAGAFIAREVRRRIGMLSAHYEGLLRTADEESRRAEAANRLKDEFLATLSHELRTPLNSVLGWARLLASGKLDKETTARAVGAIERAGWAQSRLIEDLLDISQIVAGRLHISARPTLVQPVADAVVQSLQPAAAAKEITVDTSLDPTIGPIAADPDRLQQIVWNLLSNAIKFTPAGGRVHVGVARRDHYVCLSVSDTGVGFQADTASHLFERFRQGDSSSTREYGGLGLGLGIVRHLVEAHGGTVEARSAGPNQGAEFEILLPLSAVEEYVAEAPISLPNPVPLLRGISVLVVDDDQSSLDFARSSLELFGAVVRTASSAREARERFAHDPPDVLLSDLKMPEQDGFQLISDIRRLDKARGRNTPAVALTALARAEDRRMALNAGFQMHIAKPIDPVELAVTVEQLAHRRA